MAHSTPSAVLDTNVVLDWLVFRDVRCQALADAITSGALVWVASGDMRAELSRVLARGVVAAWAPDHDAVWAAWHQFARVLTSPTRRLAETPPRCSDPDDQKFIDYGLTHEATWLLSRDRAVLKLAGRASRQGLKILTPDRWASIHGR